MRNPLLLANHLVMLAGGAIEGSKQPLDNSEKWGITIAGLGIVIAALALLVVVIFLFGKIFDVVNAKQKAKESAAAEQKKPKPAPAVQQNAAPAASAPVAAKHDTEDDTEVVAVISAVVAMMGEQDGKTYKVKSVRAVKKQQGLDGRAAWAMDGRRQNVSPF